MVREVVYASFSDDQALLKAAKALREQGHSLLDAYTPFPVHGLDEVLGEPRSRLPIVCFIAAAIGCVFSMWFQVWTSAQDWPINVGGKPFASIPAFIPVTFEVTVLFGGLLSVAAFFFRSRLFPGKRACTPDANVTSDGFWIAMERQAARVDFEALKVVLLGLGASQIQYQEREA